MYDHILVPLDCSALAEGALPHAIALAKVFDAKITLLHVLDEPRSGALRESVNPLTWQIEKAEAQSYLEAVQKRLIGTGLPVEHQILEGKAAQRILEFAENSGVDLIVISSHGASGLSPWNISSTVQKVIQGAYLPLLLVRAYKCPDSDWNNLQYKRLQVLLDGSSRSEAILPLAETIARQHDSTLLLSQVVNRPELQCRIPISHEESQLSDQLVERHRERGEQYLNDLACQLSVLAEKRLLVASSAPAALHELAEQEAVDLVLISAHGHSGNAKIPYGSLSLNFIIYGTTPLLILQDFPKENIQPRTAEQISAKENRTS
ncbi:MAG: universal stress protein [Anaerolineales bacterium]|jgi:nucleotide-binding universal stress UspA family protein|nr:universal stress protein [Anaerolineales bacterium]